MLTHVDHIRLQASAQLERARKTELGQFMTRSSVASFMASLFHQSESGDAYLLDAGAGVGSLTAAFLDRCLSGELAFEKITVAAFEVDDLLRAQLLKTLSEYSQRLDLHVEVSGQDFIEEAVNDLQIFGAGPRFTHAILNPPYKKINSGSRHRLLLRQAGIETVNLYSAFVALALALMAPHGEMVAIIPRSFCNGPYYRPFRDFLLAKAAIHQIHLFETRDQAFRDDDVLQETIIIHLERAGKQGEVTISTSSDDSFADYTAYKYSFQKIALPDDLERFIHIPNINEQNSIFLYSKFTYTLKELEIEVSTGSVVEFRLRQYIRELPEVGAMPLLYPIHFDWFSMIWPKENSKKPNSILYNDETSKLLLPNGFYTVVRRFSSKEEKKRVFASVVQPEAFHEARFLGFENHLNVFHYKKQGLPRELAFGLAVYLNSSIIDKLFRQFNGHTQVNATDLRMIKYPSRQILIEIGQWAQKQDELTQALIDEKLEHITK